MHTQPSATRRSLHAVGLLAGPLAGLLAYLLLPASYHDVHGATVEFTHAGRATAALLAWMGLWWLTEATDIEATALLPLVVLPLLGAATFRQAAAPYGDEFIFLFLGGFILALAMQRWGLDRRIALLTLRAVGTRPVNIVGGIMLATAIVGGFMSNTAKAAMMLPVGSSVIGLVQANHASLPPEFANDPSRNGRNFAVCVMLAIAYSATITGISTIIGTPPNAFLVGFVRDEIEPAFRREISFTQWMAIGVPLAVVFLPITWVLLTRVLFPIRMGDWPEGRAVMDRTYKELGPMGRGEWATLMVFIITALLWLLRRPLTAAVAPLAGLTDAGIAMIGALAMFLIPVNWSRREFVMDWRTAVKMPWGVLILFGGGLSLAAAIDSNGVAAFIGGQTHHFAGLPEVALVILVTTLVVFFSEIASNTATATTLVPILAAMAPGLGVHPFMLIVPAALAASLAFMMPVGTPPNAIVFGTGHIALPQMIKAGFWLNIIGIALITIVTYAIVKPMFGL
jgi:sodium-dependent dicarboxylate transporter 2/3/5